MLGDQDYAKGPGICYGTSAENFRMVDIEINA